jgi:hypothetical protein
MATNSTIAFSDDKAPTWIIADDFLSFPRVVSEMYQRLDTEDVVILTERHLEISTFLQAQDSTMFASFFSAPNLSSHQAVIVTDLRLFRVFYPHAALGNLFFVVSRSMKKEDVEAIDPHWQQHSIVFSDKAQQCQKLFAVEIGESPHKRCAESIRACQPDKKAKHVVVCSSSFRQELAQTLQAAVCDSDELRSVKEISGTVQQRKNAISKFNFSGSVCVLSEAPLRQLENVEYVHMLVPRYDLYSSIMYFCYNEKYRSASEHCKPGALRIVFYVDDNDEEMRKEYNETAQQITTENNDLQALLGHSCE